MSNIEKTKINFPDSIEEFVDLMYATDDCKEYLGEHLIRVEGWIHKYINYAKYREDIEMEMKYYIVLSLIFVLNQIKEFSVDEEKYIHNPDRFLELVISTLKETKDIETDEYAALALCSNILVNIICEKKEVEVDVNSSVSPLTQIIAKCPDDVLEHIFDPVWEAFYDELLGEYDDDEFQIFSEMNVRRLNKLVAERRILPSRYARMI